jgi:hypothetical protein
MWLATPVIQFKGWSIAGRSRVFSHLYIIFCFVREIYAHHYDAFSNVTFLMHDIDVVPQDQRFEIWELP